MDYKTGSMLKRYRILQGSYTVEAAFVVPVLLGISFVILYLMFFLHDYAVLQGNCSDVLCNAAEKEEKEKNYDGTLSQGLWYFNIEDIRIRQGMGKVSLEVDCTADLHIPVMELFLSRFQNFSCKEEYYTLQPEQVKGYKDSIFGQSEDESR